MANNLKEPTAPGAKGTAAVAGAAPALLGGNWTVGKDSGDVGVDTELEEEEVEAGGAPQIVLPLPMAVA